MKKKLIYVILFFALTSTLYSQTDKEKAKEKMYKGIELIDAGKYKEGIKLYEEALKLEPDNIVYLYELGYAYYLQKDYSEVIRQFEPLIKRNDTPDRMFTLLGNSYDLAGKPDKAMEVYEEGLKKFPNSGKIYLEMGVTTMNKGEIEKSLSYYEKGIDVEPGHPSNYYYLAKINCKTGDPVTGLIFGETFMNLERNTERTAEISELLYNTYKKIILINNGKIETQLTTSSEFGIVFYMVAIKLAITLGGETQNDMDAISKIRKTIVELYMQKFADKYPNPLYTYCNKILESGNFDAYSHWVLMKGSEDIEFSTWADKNQDAWSKFISWFTDNPIELNKNNKFPLEYYESSGIMVK